MGGYFWIRVMVAASWFARRWLGELVRSRRRLRLLRLIPTAGTRGAASHTADFWWRQWRHIVIRIGSGLSDECRH